MILALFFTRGVSLEKWVDTGLFYREKLIYEEHLRCGYLSRVYWLTYGCFDGELSKDLHAQKRLDQKIKVIAMPGIFKGKIGMLMYSFLMPIFQKTWLKRADIYKTNQMDGSWSAVLGKWLYRKPLIIRTGYTLSLFVKKLQESKIEIFVCQLIERLAFKSAEVGIVTSKKDLKYILDTCKCPESKLVIVPNYIQTDFFEPRVSEKYVDRIVFVGRLTKQKNLFNLISAIAKTEFTLDIYGEGELQGALGRHAKNERARVNFMGIVPNNILPEILNCYSCFILTSYFEGMPKTLLEAMACGLACIGTDVDGINELIEDGVNGVLCDTHFQGIANAVTFLMRNPERRKCLGNAAREYVMRNYSVCNVAQKELRIYEQISS